jgi:ABC-2 type transport system ATP-binding protein
VIETRQLTKRYGAVLAVDRVDLGVREGDRYGLLGPNGSGKTTLIRMLLGLVFATSGQIEIDGCPVPRRVAQVLPRIGALIEGPASYGYMSGRANLALIDAAGPGGERRTRRARIEEALDRVGLAGVDRRPVRAYSLGMRQRLGLAAALLRQPTLLILDEPTNGLDPRGIREIRDLLIELNRKGTTILLSSHLLGEVEQLCTRIGVLDRGRLVIQDELTALRAPTDRILLRTTDADRAMALLDGTLLNRDGDRLIVRGADPALLNERLVGAGVRVAELIRERRSLVDLVVEATRPGSDRVDQSRPQETTPSAEEGAQ